MPQVTFLPANRTVDVRPGASLLAAGRQAGVAIRTRCGGVAGCLMCKVKVLTPDAVTPVGDAERRKMGGEADGMRLACQTRPTGAAIVEVPEDPLKAAVRKQLERGREEEGLW